MRTALRSQIVGGLSMFLTLSTLAQTNAWINEIHYENEGADINEAVEVVIENPGILSDYEIYLYTNDGQEYDHISLDDPDIITGNSAGNYYFFSWPTSGNIQNGPADGIALVYQGVLVPNQFLSYEGTLTAVEGPANGLSSVDIGVKENKDPNLFFKSLQLVGTGSQYADFFWHVPEQSTFGAVNTNQELGGIVGNPPPVIYNVRQSPAPNHVTPSDPVFVSAEVLDTDGIASVMLYWSVANQHAHNGIPMNLVAGNTYISATGIPTHPESTNIFYSIEATDANAVPASISSMESSYLVGPPAILGWQITAQDVPFSIDFETTLSNVGKGAFGGKGFQPIPETGQLDSNTWAITGFSDGNLDFGGSKTIPNQDYTQESTEVPITPAGIYAFSIGSSVCLGIQPGDNDFNPGTITLRIQNRTSAPITTLRASFDVFVLNDQPRSSSFNFSYSADNINYSLGSSLLSSIEPAAVVPFWQKHHQVEVITGISIAPGDHYYLRWTGADISGSGSRDEFGLDNIVLVANPASINYVYNNGWTPYNPNAAATMDDNITIESGAASFTQDISINNISIHEGAILHVEQVLALHGTIINNGSLVFVNDSTKLGQLAAAPIPQTISGVTIQRQIPARRAFRFLGTAVTTATSIHDNWQEGATSSTDNPNPGFGTHITGTTVDQIHGFDGTTTGNPSLFLFDNSLQKWYDISSTDTIGLTAGTAYRLFVRGDRTTDLGDNHAVATNTILRSTGNLTIEGRTRIRLSGVAENYSFIGNPYQAIVNMNEVLENSTNVNRHHYYVWDPNLNERGAYVTVNLSNGLAVPEKSTGTTNANQYLQPGQAIFVRTLNNGPTSILFEQTDKAAFQNSTDVFRGAPNDTKTYIDLQLYEAQAYLNGGPIADGLRVNFDESGSNAVLPNDAEKIGNIDENIALMNGADYLSIENRSLPRDGEVLQLFINQYRHHNYVYKIEMSGFADDVKVYLKDDHLQTKTELTNNDFSIIHFNRNENIEKSGSPHRFSFVFDVSELSTAENNRNLDFAIYPNPIKDGNLSILVPGTIGQKLHISMYTILGQEVYNIDKRVGDRHKIKLKTSQLEPGGYVIKIQYPGKIIVGKVLIQ